MPTNKIVAGPVPVAYSNGVLNYHNQGKCKAPAVITGRSGTIGKFTYIPFGYYWPHNTSLWVTNFFGNNPLFIYYLFHTVHFENYSSGSGVPTLNRNDLHCVQISIPNKEEQEAIALYFHHLDSLIQSTTKKIDSLKQVKAASLQSMFPQEGETTPRVRFKGFEGDWEKVLLNECLSVSKDKNLDSSYTKENVLSVSDDYGICNQIKLLGRSYAGKSVANYGILKTGDIVYTKSHLKNKPFGIIKTNHCQTGIVSTLYAIYTPKEGTHANFIEVYFDLAARLNKYIHPLVNKGAKNDMKVSSENVLKGYIMIPSYDEQIKIASYFTSLDSQISLHSQRLEKLKQIKSACLDNMFV